MSKQLSSLLNQVRNIQHQNSSPESKFVLEFVELWLEVHDQAKEAALIDIDEISRKLLKNHTLPFYERNKEVGFLKKIESFTKNISSILMEVKDRGGVLTIPRHLVIYEIIKQDDSMLISYLNRLQKEESQLNFSQLVELIVAPLLNITIPVDRLDIDLFKAICVLSKKELIPAQFIRGPSFHDIAEFVNKSLSTVTRRMSQITMLDIINIARYIDMARLGYETLLLHHLSPFPDSYSQYLLYTANFFRRKFSIIQIPISQPLLIDALINEISPEYSVPIDQRIISWCFDGLSRFKEGWVHPPPIFHSQAEINFQKSAPNLALETRVEKLQFRSLTPADLKILDAFLVTNFSSLQNFSKHINLSVKEISRRVKEYIQNQLLFNSAQFFRLGLDLSIFFYIRDPGSGIPWLSHLQTFPKIDVFLYKENYLYIAHLDRSFISIYDLNTEQFLERVIPLEGYFPNFIFANNNYSKIYSLNIRSDSVSVIDVNSKALEKVIDLHAYPIPNETSTTSSVLLTTSTGSITLTPGFGYSISVVGLLILSIGFLLARKQKKPRVKGFRDSQWNK